MANIVDFISMKLRPYGQIALAIFLIILFLGLSYYAYKTYLKKSTATSKKYKDVANSQQDNGELNIMMFHVDWCPFCVKSLPEWKQFCNEYNGKRVNGKTIRCDPEGTNCTDDSDEKILAMLEEYDIKSYPTVILFNGNKRYDYDAKITKSNLEQFIKTVAL
jgi:thiol-disulfide isomerase/thioredoxin